MTSLPTKLVAAAFLLSLAAFPGHADSTPPVAALDLDLSKPFDTRSSWQFHVTGESGVYDVRADWGPPGLLHLCLQRTPSAACEPLQMIPKASYANFAEAWAPHYLNDAEVVYAGSAKIPLLLIETASLPSGNGDQLIYTQLLAYDRATDRFKQAYAKDTGHNNNQEVRFMTAGPLAGDVISAEPTENAPFGYWITVSTLAPTLEYKQVLRYRSGTRYGDGNPLAVIDAEMPAIEQRLGVWHPNQPLPAPGPCAKPHLVHQVLWCG